MVIPEDNTLVREKFADHVLLFFLVMCRWDLRVDISPNLLILTLKGIASEEQFRGVLVHDLAWLVVQDEIKDAVGKVLEGDWVDTREASTNFAAYDYALFGVKCDARGKALRQLLKVVKNQ